MNRKDPNAAMWFRAGFAGFVVLLVLALFPYTPQPASDIKNVIIAVAAVVFAAAWFAYAWMTDVPFRLPRLFFVPALLFCAVHLVAALISPYPMHSLAESVRVCQLVILYLVVSQLVSRPIEARPILVAVVASVSLSSVYAVSQHFGLDPFPWSDTLKNLDEYRNLPGTFGNPNIAGHALILTIIIAAYLVLATGQRWCWIALPLLVVHLFATGHRAGILALSAAATVAIAARTVRNRVSSPHSAALRTLAVTASAGLMLVGAAAGFTLAVQQTPFPLDQSLLLRYNANYGAARMVIDAPLSGFGPGNFKIANTPYWTAFEQRHYAERRMMNANVHCDSIEYAIECGLAGAWLYFALLITGVWYGLRIAAGDGPPAHRATALAVATAFSAAFVDGLFGFNLRVPVSACLVFVLMGVLDGLVSPPASSKSPVPPLLIYSGTVALALGSLLLSVRGFLAEVDHQDARRAIRERAFEQAVYIAGHGRSLAPWMWELPILQGNALSQLGRDELAANAYEKALERNPNSLTAWIGLAQCRFRAELGQLRERESASAGQAAQRALELCRYLPEAHDLLGRAAMNEAQHASGDDKRDALERAAKHLCAALEFAGHGKQEHVRLLASVRSELGDLDAAERLLGNALRAAPDDPLTWEAAHEFAISAGRTGSFHTRARHLVQSLFRNPSSTPTQRSLALAWLAVFAKEQGDGPATYRTFAELAIETDPTNESAWSIAADMAQSIGGAAWFDALVLRTVTVRPDHEGDGVPPAVLAYARVLRDGPDRLPSAMADLAAHARRDIERGNRIEKRKQLRSLADRFEQIVERDAASMKDAGMGHTNLATLYAWAGDIDKANAHYTRAIELIHGDDRKIDCFLSHARALLAYDRARDAEQLLRGRMSLVRQDYRLQWALADALAGQQRTTEALAEYERLLREFTLEPSTQQQIEEAAAELRAAM